MWKRLFFSLAATAALLHQPGTGRAAVTQAFEKNWNLCAQAVSDRERREVIPAHLLSAISRAESGRWNAEKQANIAWPWTVTSGGRGRFFDTKAEAVAEVEILLTQGVRNIDVGCMQINLAAHPDAFESLDAAFDPAINAAYGARYLKAMQRRTGNWLAAAGAYHSMTPHLSAKYRAKVARIWNAARGLPAPRLEAAKPEGAPKRRPSAIDYGRLADLNNRFRQRRGLATTTQPVDPATRRLQRRHQQISAWRQARGRGKDLSHLAAVRRAERTQRRKRELVSFGKTDRATAFAERRRAQLDDWRAKRLVTFSHAGN